MNYPHQELTHRIIGCAIEVHRELGPGLLEGVYESALSLKLKLAGLAFQRQRSLPVVYKGTNLQLDYRIDLLVEDLVVLELKAVEKLLPIHEAQLLTHMKLSQRSLGLLVNFNVPILKEGIVRRVL